MLLFGPFYEAYVLQVKAAGILISFSLDCSILRGFRPLFELPFSEPVLFSREWRSRRPKSPQGECYTALTFNFSGEGNA
jgi:hypothetical protein